jgi:hypothetical protein
MKRSEVDITKTCYACCLATVLLVAVWIVWSSMTPVQGGQFDDTDANADGIVEAVGPDLRRVNELQREEINQLMVALREADPDHPFVVE